jgi:pyruvate dehydrogenase E1 component beta subunit
VLKQIRLVVLERKRRSFLGVASEITYIQFKNVLSTFLMRQFNVLLLADTPAPYSPVLLRDGLPNAADVING